MIPIWKISGRLGNSMFQTAYLYAQMRDGLIPDIYVQGQKYFEKYEKEIKEMFGKGIGFVPEVGIHIRRGDYVGNPFYVDLSETDYYHKAIALFPDKNFLVFSDDIEYAKSFIGIHYLSESKRFKYSEGNDEVTDLNLMASCSSVIMANSSLSWWAGFLCPNPAKTVVYPSEWFTDSITRIDFPKSWTKI